MQSPFENALNQVARAAQLLPNSDALLKRLKHPEREVSTSIPVVMDDGSTAYFEGYRVQYCSALGPYKGGIRFHPDANIDEVRALALWMTLKTAVANLRLGGGKGGVTVDAKKLSVGEHERLARGWVRSLHQVLGPTIDVPGPDVGVTAQTMAWMNEEYKKISGEMTDATFTGKPLGQGGSEGRVLATALGGWYAFEALQKAVGITQGATVAIQGMGNVGGNAATIFQNKGYKVVALSDSHGGVYGETGLDVAAVEQFKKDHGSLKDFPDARQVSNAELLTLSVDVLIPAALENQITEANAGQVRAKMVLELANGPTTPEADDILHDKGVVVVPDILANCGGVVVSAFEWEQNLKHEHWSEEQVNAKLKTILTEQAAVVAARAIHLKTDLRRAAGVLALERIQAALIVH